MGIACTTLRPLFRRLLRLAGAAVFALGQAFASTAGGATKAVAAIAQQNEIAVTTTKDAGEGSLRQALIHANASDGPDVIRFDSIVGPFATPQTIILQSTLPELVGEVLIDGYIEKRLWKPTGVTVSGNNAQQVFRVAPGAKVTIQSLTIAHGHAERGGGIANRGDLLIKGVTFQGNTAERDGGAIANLGGRLTVINSTIVDNRAGGAGGGLAGHEGMLTITNCTFSGNEAPKGGGLFSSGALLLRNTILANSGSGTDCLATGALDPASTHNLIEANAGCGTPISTADPGLRKPGHYNGPTLTMPLGGKSPAINLGDNDSAVDEQGLPLKWDQRGEGDPRFAVGITDIGAFERQGILQLMVDTPEDTEARSCTRSGPSNCSLRGAITLANAAKKINRITFDPRVFSVSRAIVPTRPLPEVTADVTLDAQGTSGITVRGEFGVLRKTEGTEVELKDITFENGQ